MVKALEGYRVIDLGNVLAGPLVSQHMSDMGVEVIKVETRTRLDGTRRGRPIVGEDIAGGDQGQWPELQPLFHCLNHNKMGVTVDLKKPEGVEAVKRLVSLSDAVITNSAPGVMDRIGLSYQALKAVKPDIVMASMPGAGESGPLKDVLAYASITSALSGLMGLIGYPGHMTGQTQGAWCDVVASLTALVAVLAAIRHRNQTGEGQYIEIAQMEAAAAPLGEGIMDVVMNGRVPESQGMEHAVMAPHGNYPCAGEDKWVSIAIPHERQWDAFCKAIGNPSWMASPEFADAYSRSVHKEALDGHIAEWSRGHTAEEATELLQAAGVAAMSVMNIEDQFTDPNLREREAYVEIEHPKVGAEWIPGMPWLLSDTPGRIERHAPLMGEHNLQVFQELLGMDAEQYQALEAEGVFA